MKRIIGFLIVAVIGAPALLAVTAGTSSLSQVHSQGQFFNDGEREFAYTATSAPHQQNGVLLADGYVFVVYFNKDDKLCLSRRLESGGTWKTLTFSYTQSDPDAHRTANIAVSPGDKRLHIIWGMHVNTLNYIVTTNTNATTKSDSQFTTSLFDAKRNYLASGQTLLKVSYPRFFIGEDDKLLVSWRDDGGSGNANNYIATYNGNKLWSGRRKVLDGQSGHSYLGNPTRCGYLNDIGYRAGKTHISWTWRETTQGQSGGLVTNHDLMYANSDDNGSTWKNKDGSTVGTSGSGSYKINLVSPVKFKTLDYEDGVENQCGQAIDSSGNVHVVVRQKNASGVKKLFYYRKTASGTSFSEAELSVSSSARPKVYADPTSDSKQTLYIVTVAGDKVKVYGANKGGNNWGTWSTLYTSSVDYLTATAQLADDGRTLHILAQRKPTNTATASYSRIDLIKLPVTP